MSTTKTYVRHRYTRADFLSTIPRRYDNRHPLIAVEFRWSTDDWSQLDQEANMHQFEPTIQSLSMHDQDPLR
jgi:hypothetical protein